jgi:hypothetical protein
MELLKQLVRDTFPNYFFIFSLACLVVRIGVLGTWSVGELDESESCLILSSKSSKVVAVAMEQLCM